MDFYKLYAEAGHVGMLLHKEWEECVKPNDKQKVN